MENDIHNILINTYIAIFALGLIAGIVLFRR